MPTLHEVYGVIDQPRIRLGTLFPQQSMGVILFGPYARGDAQDGSDIDVRILIDAPRQAIAEKNWLVGEAVAELLLEHGVVVSPIVENRAYFQRQAQLLPFFRGIAQEGVLVSA